LVGEEQRAVLPTLGNVGGGFNPTESPIAAVVSCSGNATATWRTSGLHAVTAASARHLTIAAIAHRCRKIAPQPLAVHVTPDIPRRMQPL